MKITKSQLKQIIKEELNELDLGDAESMPAPSGTDQGEGIVRQHLGKIVADLAEGGLLPHLPSTMPDSGHTAVVPVLDGLAVEMYRMIMAKMGTT